MGRLLDIARSTLPRDEVLGMRLRIALAQLAGLVDRDVEAEVMVQTIRGKVYLRLTKEGTIVLARVDGLERRNPTAPQWAAVEDMLREAVA
jgi:hypothetical protein